MRVLLAAAVSLAAAAVSSASATTPRTDTLYSRASGTISAFAQDDKLIAWFTPDAKGCNAVHVHSVFNGLKVDLPKQRDSHNVTCRWNVGDSPVELAIAGKTSNVLWTLHESSPLEFDYLVGAGAGDRRERRLQELAHTNRGNGLWFGGVAGDGTTLAYAVTSVDYEDEAGCLAGTGSCLMKRAGGGVYRVIGRQQRPKLVPGTNHGAVAIAAGGGRIAYVTTGSVTKRGKPVAGADLPIQIVDAANGEVVSSISPQGTPLAIALSAHVLAALERTPLGLRLATYSASGGQPIGSAPVALSTSPVLTVSDRFVVFHVGRSIRAVQIATGRVRTLITAAAPPIGLSLEGTRLAWAENLKHGWRIRALHIS
ncbi:MAG: hypothetical protein QOE43_2037 [Gaiellaceae bacterium]|jgi:hypothetical protein|nr:hypothetical protein [Gaiellaceae bacterium]